MMKVQLPQWFLLAVQLLVFFLELGHHHPVEGFFVLGRKSSGGSPPTPPPPSPPNHRPVDDGSFHNDGGSSDSVLRATFAQDASGTTTEEEMEEKKRARQVNKLNRGRWGAHKSKKENRNRNNKSKNIPRAINKLSRGGSSGSSAITDNNLKRESSIRDDSKALAKNVASSLLAPFRSASKALSSIFRSKEKFMEEKLIKELSTMPVEHITLVGNNKTNSTVLPLEVVELAARRAGIIGQPLTPETVQEFARAIKRWYARQGYVLHALKAANLRPETATAEIELLEPISSNKPVNLVFCQQLVIDPETGELYTFRQYKNKYSSLSSSSRKKGKEKNGNNMLSLAEANKTLVEISGRTRPAKIASALNLRPGQPFKWDEQRWKAVANSGIFSSILDVSPQLMDDGSVQLHITVLEEKGSHVQYGLGRSGYTGAWAGDLNLEQGNLFGGGESVGISVARGPKDGAPSLRFRFSNLNFGLDGGYEVEAFSECIGSKSNEPHVQLLEIATLPNPEQNKQPQTSNVVPTKAGETYAQSENDQDDTHVPQDANDEAPSTPNPDAEFDATDLDYDNDILVNRRGATFRIQNPFHVDLLHKSTVTCSLERTTTMGGWHEEIGSCTLFLGPFSGQLSLFDNDARSNIDCKLLTGSRFQQKHPTRTHSRQEKSSSSSSRLDNFVPPSLENIRFWPYLAGSATTRQTIPLISTPTRDKRPVVLALLHSVTTSTPSLPRHETKAQGIANSIRGSLSEDEGVATAVRGTTELRIPLDIPKIQTQQDGKIVFFGDWVYATSDSKCPMRRKSCVGLGLRKTVQGIPIRYDVCYTHEGQIRHSVGIGRDFEA
ncbi:hypothetical protein ACA910_002632 [Epithemia clementina (nom. ined.)]